MHRRWLTMIVALLACSAVEERPGAALGPDHRPAIASVDSCEDKSCGDRCQCPADSTSWTCEAGESGWCDLEGRCDSLFVLMGCQCASDSDCTETPQCHSCPDGTTTCPEPTCSSGLCEPGYPDCGPSPGYDPCEGKGCNEPCTLCDPAIPDCTEPPPEQRYCFGGCGEPGMCSE